MKSLKKFVLPSIILIAFLLRFYNLGSYPALNADEAALGYNAYSLLKTGLDEHGNSWPVHLQSFNDYKPALTAYLMMPTIALFGLNEWSVRVIPALLGVATIPILYLLVKQLFKKDIYAPRSDVFALIAALLLAVSPWHIHFSRGAWEVNIATFLITAGLYAFLKALEKQRYFIISAICFVLSLYTYHSARLIVPLLGAGLLLFYRHELLKFRRSLVLPLILAAVLCVPLLYSLRGPAGLARAGGVAIWADKGTENRANELRGDYSNLNSPAAKIFHNKPVLYTMFFLNNWVEHYSGQFLFLSGDDIQRNKVPETGQLYLIELLTLGISLFYICKKISRDWGIVFWWLLIAPIPAALTFQSPHALRAESMVIPLVIISSFGFYKIVEMIRATKLNRRLLIAPYSVLLLVCFWFITTYLHMYYIHMSKTYPFSSQYGVKELVSYIESMPDRNKQLIVTDRYDQPYILFLFYMRYDPSVFQKNHTLGPKDQFGFSTVRNFDKFEFRSISYEQTHLDNLGATLVGTSEEMPKEANIVKDIFGTNGYRYFRIIQN